MSTEAFKRGIAAAAKVFTSDSRKYRINGTQLKCNLCNCTSFEYRKVLLNTTVATLLNFDWANSNASAMVCDDCSHITWYLKEAERIL